MLDDLEENDIATVHMIFQKLGTENFDVEKIIQIAKSLMEQYTPENLVYDN